MTSTAAALSVQRFLSNSYRVFAALAVFAWVAVWIGCSVPPAQQDHVVGDIGHIGVRKTDGRVEGVVIGATHGLTEPYAAEVATALSDHTGAGLVIAYGFRATRIPVAQPLVHMSPVATSIAAGRRPGSVYSQFRSLLQGAVAGPIHFYVGIRAIDSKTPVNRIEVATGGLSFEQVGALKDLFLRIRDRAIEGSVIPKVDMRLNPVDDVSWNVTGVKQHGVLLLAERGLILRLPKALADPRVKSVYSKIFNEWVSETLTLVAQNPSRLPAIQVKLMPYGRMETIPSRNNTAGIVIGAPHGSFDRFTSELAEALSYRTSLAAVTAKGFSPTEGGGWRINVNRPTEKRYPRGEPEQERGTERAREAYRRYRETVLKAAGGALDLYIDLHENGIDDDIDVATLGISGAEARGVKEAYREIRDHMIQLRPELPKVDMAIEPIDKVTFTARVAKEQGILRLAKQSFHFEMPTHRLFYDQRVRHAYTEILSELIQRITALQSNRIQARAASSIADK